MSNHTKKSIDGASAGGFRAKLEHYVYSGERKHVVAGIAIFGFIFGVPWYLMTRGKFYFFCSTFLFAFHSCCLTLGYYWVDLDFQFVHDFFFKYVILVLFLWILFDANDVIIGNVICCSKLWISVNLIGFLLKAIRTNRVSPSWFVSLVRWLFGLVVGMLELYGRKFNFFIHIKGWWTESICRRWSLTFSFV